MKPRSRRSNVSPNLVSPLNKVPYESDISLAVKGLKNIESVNVEYSEDSPFNSASVNLESVPTEGHTPADYGSQSRTLIDAQLGAFEAIEQSEYQQEKLEEDAEQHESKSK